MINKDEYKRITKEEKNYQKNPRYQIKILIEKNNVILLNFSKFKEMKKPYFIRL